MKKSGRRPRSSRRKQIQDTFSGAVWFVEGDIKACFDSFDHRVLIDILRRRIDDEHFIALLWKFLKAGYMESWTYHHTYSGTPQGSGISPVLANIYLNELDNHVEEYQQRFDIGSPKRRKKTTRYNTLAVYKRNAMKRYRERWDEMTAAERAAAAKEVKVMKAEMLSLPPLTP